MYVMQIVGTRFLVTFVRRPVACASSARGRVPRRRAVLLFVLIIIIIRYFIVFIMLSCCD